MNFCYRFKSHGKKKPTKEEKIDNDFKEARILNHTVGILGNIQIQAESNNQIQPIILEGEKLLEFHNVNYVVDQSVNDEGVKNENESMDIEVNSKNSDTFQTKGESSNCSQSESTMVTFTQSEGFGTYQSYG